MNAYSDARNLIVCYIPNSISVRELKEMFGQFGPVLRCTIITDDFGISKGYGFVLFEFEADAFAAKKAMHQFYVRDGNKVKYLRVEIARGPGYGTIATKAPPAYQPVIAINSFCPGALNGYLPYV